MFHPLRFWDYSYSCLAYTLTNLAHLTKDVSGASVPSDAPYRPPFFRNEHLLQRKALVKFMPPPVCCAGLTSSLN